MLAAAARLRRREEFSQAVRKGRRVSRGTLVVHLVTPENAPNPARPDGARAGFVVSKAVGDAVTRNAVKRRLRHLVRDHLNELPAGSGLVVRALPAAASRSYRQLESDLLAALQAARRPRTMR